MKIDRQQVYRKYNGHCAYCGQEIEYRDMQVDHMFPKCLDGMYDWGGLKYKGTHIDEYDNLMPSCRICNHYKRANNLESYRNLMTTLHERLMKIYIVRVAVKYGIAKITPFDGMFYFEKQNKNEM